MAMDQQHPFREGSDLINMLESNSLSDVQQVKSLIHENLNETKDTWLLYGLVDYYITTGSERCLDILTGIKEPHDKHLFDKLTEYLKTPVTRLEALTLLNHVVCKQPSWLYKIASHSVLATLLKLLKNETDVPVVMSALLILVTLLPMIPALISPHLNNIFEIFSRLIAWKTNKPGSVPEVHILHLQVGVYALFHRLYGMYPCNFLAYLRSHYGNREHLPIFAETLRPMLERVRMHPLLVTASKEAEVSTTRWRSMETHDVVMECAKVSLDALEGTREEVIPQGSYFHPSLTPFTSGNQDSGVLPLTVETGMTWWASQDSVLGQMLQDGTNCSSSHGLHLCTPPPSRTSPESSLNDLSASLPPPLTPPVASVNTTESLHSSEFSASRGHEQKLDRSGQFAGHSQPASPFFKIASPFKFPPSSDVDQEVCDIVAAATANKSENTCATIGSGCQSMALQSSEAEEQHEIYERSDSVIHDDTDGIPAAELEDSVEYLADKPWIQFVRTVNRQRYYSQCNTDVTEVPAPSNEHKRSLSCPDISNSSVDAEELGEKEMLVSQSRSERPEEVRDYRVEDHSASAHPVPLPADAPRHSGAVIENQCKPPLSYGHLFAAALPPMVMSRCSQCSHCQSGKEITIHMTPSEILDRHIQYGTSLYSKELRALPITSTKPTNWTHFGGAPPSDEIDILRGQVILLHNQLLFERHKREVHAERNRRLLARNKKARALEEQNLAMKEQLQLQERHVADLNYARIQLLGEIGLLKDKNQCYEQDIVSKNKSLKQLEEDCNEKNKTLIVQLEEQTSENCTLRKLLRDDQARLLTATLDLENIQSKVTVNDDLKKELERLNKELVLMGELQQKYREKFHSFPYSSNARVEVSHHSATYAEEICGLKQLCESRLQQLEAHKSRLAELEAQIIKKDLAIKTQKNLTRQAKEECEEHMQVIKESNRQLQSMCMKLVEHIVHKLDNLNKPSLSSVELKETESCKDNFDSVIGVEQSVRRIPVADSASKDSVHAVSIENYLHRFQQQEPIEMPDTLLDFDNGTWEYIKKRVGVSQAGGEVSIDSLVTGFERWRQSCSEAQVLSDAGASAFTEQLGDKGYVPGKQT